MNWNNEREEARIILYLSGFDDGEIGALSEPAVGKSNVCLWRGRRALPPNNGLGDRKWYPSYNPSEKALSNSPGHTLSKERQELLFRLYNEGLNDVEIAKKADRSRATIREWRLKRGLPVNVSQGRQPNKKSQSEIGARKSEKKKIAGAAKTRKARKKQIKGKFKQKPKKRVAAKERKMGVRQLREKIAREKEEEIIASLPSKEEVYQKVRNSLNGQITTKQLIKQGYGDVGSKRGDTIHKLRQLVDCERLLGLDTDKKDRILWIA